MICSQFFGFSLQIAEHAYEYADILADGSLDSTKKKMGYRLQKITGGVYLIAKGVQLKLTGINIDFIRGHLKTQFFKYVIMSMAESSRKWSSRPFIGKF